MPVYLKQWRDGDFTLLYAKDLEDALRILDDQACIEPHTVLQLNAGDLNVTFTLRENGELVCRELSPAVEQAREQCYPELMSILKDYRPDLVTDPRQKELIGKAVDDEVKIRKESKLDTRLKARRRRIERALGK
jgi:hypothetical protein